jgi:hypothetical protein
VMVEIAGAPRGFRGAPVRHGDLHRLRRRSFMRFFELGFWTTMCARFRTCDCGRLGCLNPVDFMCTPLPWDSAPIGSSRSRSRRLFCGPSRFMSTSHRKMLVIRRWQRSSAHANCVVADRSP